MPHLPASTSDPPSLAERLNEPHTAAVLHRLLDRAEALDRTLAAASELPNLAAIAVDMFDALSRKANEGGVDIEQRATDMLKLLVQVTEPPNLRAIEALVARLPQLAAASSSLENLPGLLAIATDVFDEWSTKLKAQGIDIEQSLRQGLHAALYLGGQVQKEELDRIGYLLKSAVMSENSVATVGLAGSALSQCHRGTCADPVPKRIGLWGLLGALRDPNAQRAIAFGLQFAKCFGGELERDPANSPRTVISPTQGVTP
jgi:hypothetical protein